MLDKWRALLDCEDVEEPLTPAYEFASVGESVILHDGGEGGSAGRVELTFVGQPNLRWTGFPDSTPATPEATGISFQLQRHGVEASVDGHRVGRDHGVLNYMEFAAPNTQAHHVVAHWVNLPNIFAAGRIATEKATWNGRWRFEVDGWRITVDRRQDHDKVMARAADQSSYVLTHVMEVRRTDDAVFDVEAAKRLLEGLRVCVSFAFGRWIAPILPVGYDADGEVVWEEWTTPLCDPAMSVGFGWLHRSHTDDLVRLLSCALPRLATLGMPDILRYQMINAVLAVQSGFVEQRMSATFSALENLEWSILVLDSRLSHTKYKKMSGAERLREVLTLADIPHDLDATTFPALQAFVANAAIPDGPTAVVEVRNRLTHPKSPHDEVYQFDGLVRETWFLARRYLTLSILYSIGYQGSYVRMTPPFGWASHSVRVPWASNSPVGSA
ncbi:hypothetical protein ACIA5G_46110 [Amycolatopsis sp. NPDC051758]|uniref:hypothetical protein n=1 Tax=Amycolatopsis sp. NPDC051758 TaxID=3363935 RepID=UPI0037BC7BAC